MVLSVGIFSQFNSEQINDPAFSLEALWNHCMAVATGAKRIAKEEGAAKEVIEDSFLAGLLHDIGVLIIEQSFSGDYIKARTLAAEQGLSLQQAEREIFGATHGAVGAYLLGLWALADPVVEAVAFHQEPSLTEQRSFSPLAAVHVADMLERTGMPNAASNDGMVDESYLEEAGLTDRLDCWRELLTSDEE